MRCSKDGCGREDIKASGLCVGCYNQKWYRANRKKHKADARRNTVRYKAERTRIVNEFKSTGCVACGYSEHPEAMDCHHLRDKYMSIGSMLSDGFGLGRLRIELEKCVPLCVMCHRLLHAGIICLEAEMDQALVS